MKAFRSFRLLMLAGAVVLATGGVRTARAQDPDDQTRGVARISLMDGEVSVKRGDAAEWVAGVINAPLLSADRISTAPNSRAEVQFDAANLMRIGGNAEVNLATVEYGRYQIEVAHGTVTYVVLRPSSANVEVDTPSVSVRPSKQGVYRISVNDAGETQVVVRAGEVEVFTPRGSQWVSAGQMMQARGSSSDPEFQIVSAIPIDDWDRWNQSRDRMLTQTASYQYVPQGVYGVEDLDPYGNWNYVPSYGYVWCPTGVGADWAPYRRGRWAWEDWYGWTWVSYDPWGWAPYHYGRWFWESRFGWCWYPGMLGVRHYWSPALVAFFGYGHGVGVGFGFGNLGWVPLAPYEVFHPWWGRGFYGRGFNERINITNVNITNVYRNARFGNGVSGMGVNEFRSGRFNAIGRVAGDQVRTAGLVRGQMPIAPGASHLQFANHGAAFVPRSSGNTRFFAHQQPSAPQRMPFAQQQRAFEQTGQRFGNQGRGAMNAGAAAPNATPNMGGGRQAEMERGAFQGQQPAARPGGPAGMTRGGQSPGGWRRFGEPAGQGQAPASRGSNPAFQNTRPPAASGGSQGGSGGGWQRFGSPRGQTGPTPASPRGGNPAFENTRPPAASGGNGSGWGRFGEPRGTPRAADPAPRSNYQGGSGFGGPRYSAPAAPPVVRERSNAPSYSAPRYNAPRSAPSYSAPRSAPSFSAPRSSPPSRGGGGFSAPRGGGGGGGGSRPSGGGNSRGRH